MSFELKDVWFRYFGAARPALAEVSASFPAGKHTFVLGPNGAGKTTLFRVMLGLVVPGSGSAAYEGKMSQEWSRRELARRCGVVSQEPGNLFPFTVREMVEMGRNPYVGSWRSLSADDEAVIERALERTDLLGLADRTVSNLSGGELQRVKVARALAQTPATLLLDEPTAHLDLGHEMEIFSLLRQLTEDEEFTVITITHNMNLASRFADHVVLLDGGHVLAAGSPREVLEPERLKKAFGWPVRVEDQGSLGLQIVPLEP